MNSDGNNPQDGWQVAEEESFNLAVAQLGGHEFVDEILRPVDYALSRKPTGFRKIPGYNSLYLAKTKLRISGRKVIPSYRLWFRVIPWKNEVWKLWIEMAPPEDMGIAVDPWDDEEIPF